MLEPYCVHEKFNNYSKQFKWCVYDIFLYWAIDLDFLTCGFKNLYKIVIYCNFKTS